MQKIDLNMLGSSEDVYLVSAKDHYISVPKGTVVKPVNVIFNKGEGVFRQQSDESFKWYDMVDKYEFSNEKIFYSLGMYGKALKISYGIDAHGHGVIGVRGDNGTNAVYSITEFRRLIEHVDDLITGRVFMDKHELEYLNAEDADFPLQIVVIHSLINSPNYRITYKCLEDRDISPSSIHATFKGLVNRNILQRLEIKEGRRWIYTGKMHKEVLESYLHSIGRNTNVNI